VPMCYTETTLSIVSLHQILKFEIFTQQTQAPANRNARNGNRALAIAIR